VLGGLTLVLAACGGAPSQAGGGGPRFQQQPGTEFLERKSGRIVFIGADGNIYTTDQGGVNQTRLTSDASLTDNFYHLYRWPTWSPDGSQVAFVGESGSLDEESSVSTDTVLYTVSPDGGVLTEAYTGGNALYYLYWSPDGQYLSFLTLDEADLTTDLQAVSADGSSGGAFEIGSGRPLYLSWAPDGGSVLIHIDGEQPGGVLGAVELEGQSTARLELEELPYSPASFQAPAWSPDGDKLLFATDGESGADQLVLTDAQGREPRVIANYSGKIAFGWSPNSRYVAYIISPEPAEFRDGPSLGVIGSLHVYDLRRNEQITIAEGEQVMAFFWSPNSRRLAYYVPSIVELEETGQQAVQLELNIAKARSGDSHQLLQFLSPPEFLQVLFLFDQFQRSATIWSPDSQYVVFAIQDERPIIAVMHASGTIDPRGLAEGTVAFWSWE
jgi:TolB protein